MSVVGQPPPGSIRRNNQQSEDYGTTIGPLAFLVNQKVIILLDDVQHVALERHFFHRCLRSEVEKIYFDEDWYLKTYPDVAAAIDAGDVAGARVHYVMFGYYEHRLPYSIEVDETWYLKVYKDVANAVAKGLFSSAIGHFLEVGFREGRFPYPGFQLRHTTAS